MPQVVMVAGPNGAGKSTFIRVHLPSRMVHDFVRLDADEIERGLDSSIDGADRRALAAGRIMIERIQSVIDARGNLFLETTLTSRSYSYRIPGWQRAGYRVALVYLALPSIDASIERVRRRVEAGGHNIPEATLRRRFGRSTRLLNEVYKSIVDEWYIWQSVEGQFIPNSAWDTP